MCCLFMQECTDVLADGKLIMTNQVRQVRPDRCDPRAPQQFRHEEGRGPESDASYRSGNYPTMREQGGREVDRHGIMQGDRNGVDVGGRHCSRNHADDRVNGNDNGLYRNDAAGRPAASNASRFQDRFDDDGRRFDMEMNQRNGQTCLCLNGRMTHFLVSSRRNE